MIYSTLGMEKAYFILLICAPGCSLLQINGILHRDVLLPCIVTYNDVFNYKDLVVNWQRENDDIVHSYHYEADQHKYQAKEFQGRTQLFPEQFPNGNVSLLLKHTQTSDAGRYICYVFLNDHKGFTTKTMELVLPSLKGIAGDQIDTSHPDEATTEMRTQSNEDGEKEKSVNWINIALPSLFVILISLVILVIVSKRKQIIFCKNVDNSTWMTAHGNTTEKTRLLENDSLKEHVLNYKTSVLNTFEPSCPSSSSEHEQHGCLERTLRVLEEPKQQHRNCEILKDMFKSKDSAEILSSEKFFTTKNINLSSRRKLLLGEAGIGKSCFSKGLQSHWAVGDKDIFYECIIYFTFTEMNSIQKSLSVKELLGNKCKELEPVLPQLLLSDKLLIAFDGLDEFRFDLTENQPLDVLNIDTPLHINLLVSYILSKRLLPDTDVLVTSRPNSLSKFHQYFDKIYAMEGFNDDQFVQYLNKFASSLEIATSVNEVVKKSKMSSLVSIPLLSSAVCEISKKQHFLKCKEGLNTSSQIMVTLLKCCVREAIYSTETSDTKCCVQDLESGLQLPDNIMKVICNIAKVSYENLVHGVDEIDLQGLWESCEHTKHLLKSFSDFFFKKTKHTRALEYHHAVIRDMFAALHCVWEIKDMTELKECLDAWAWGEITDLQRNGSLLQDITLKHPIVLRNFLRFFVGLLNYKNVHSLLSDDPIHSKEMLSFLHQWIQDGLRRTSEANHLNLYHWIFELHNASLNEKLSDYHKNVKLFNTPLTMLDVRALQFSLETSSLESIDLTLCDLSDENLQQLQNVVKKCKHVTLSSNKLTVETARLLQKILETPGCSIEHLRLGTNRLGSRGAQCIWKSLETNRSLRVLSLKDNQIEDEGTEGMVHSLKMNCTLDELYLCMNTFTELGIRNIAELRQHRRDLKVVVKLCEDEELLHYVDVQVQGLNGDGWKQYEKEWLLQILQIVHKDLSDDEATNENCSEKVKCIREEILEKINIIGETKAHTPLKMNQNKYEILQEIKIMGEKSLHRVSENLNIISAIEKI